MTIAETPLINVPNLVARVHRFNTVGQIVPPGHFNADRVGFYIGMQLEELAEMVKFVAMGHVVGNDRGAVATLANFMDQMGKEFKAGKHYGAVLRADREELLDGAIDSLVVAAGCLVYQTPKHGPAVEHVLERNDAKEFDDGLFHHDENGKIIKPVGWIKPNLLPFIDQSGLPADDEPDDTVR